MVFTISSKCFDNVLSFALVQIAIDHDELDLSSMIEKGRAGLELMYRATEVAMVTSTKNNRSLTKDYRSLHHNKSSIV